MAYPGYLTVIYINITYVIDIYLFEIRLFCYKKLQSVFATKFVPQLR